jgi:hypothetical protein
VLDQVDTERDHRNVGGPQRPGGVTVVAGGVEDDEVGPGADDGLDRWPDTIAQIGHRRRFGRPRVPVRPADDTVTGA